MGKILEAFLTDQLRVDDVTGKKSPKHQKLCEKNCELQDKLTES